MEYIIGRRRLTFDQSSRFLRMEWYAPRGRGWTIYLWHPKAATGFHFSRSEGHGWRADLGLIEVVWR